jgi:hypothetical protein
MKKNREGYEQLGVQAAELITAVMSALKQREQDEALVRAMQVYVGNLRKCAGNTLDACAALILERPACFRRLRSPSRSGCPLLTVTLEANVTVLIHGCATRRQMRSAGTKIRMSWRSCVGSSRML